MLTLKNGSACLIHCTSLFHCSTLVCLNGSDNSACSTVISTNSCCPLIVEPNLVHASTSIML